MKVFAANMVRTHFAAHAARIVLALVVITGLGCRSRSERDLVERELRMHEDQVYALQDYLSEYQSIVQRLRCENLELKQQLAQAQIAESQGRQGTVPPARGTQDDSWSPDRPRSRSLLDRERAADQPDPFKDDGPAGVTPTTPDIEIDVEEPEIELGTPAPMTPTTPPAAAPERGTSAPLRTEPAPPAIVPTQVLSDAQPLRPASQSEATEVFGEIVQLADHDEPSLHVEVRPRSIVGMPLDFAGVLEVMLLDPAAGPTAPALARWEFTAEEVEQAWRDPESRQVFDVLAGVPAELPLDRPLELWIRLLPTEGGKILASTELQPSEVEIVAADESESSAEITDNNVTTAGHWVPSDPESVPKQANAEGGWSPRK
jgi:hypothetical protein